jgi:hypothetical protein
MTRLAHGRKCTMNIRTEKFPRPPDKKETATPGDNRDGGERLRKHDNHNANRNAHNQQAACRAIEAGLVYLPDACNLAAILRPLDHAQRLWLGASSMLALPADTAEQLSEAVLHDLRAGPPPVTFWSLRDEAISWAAFASRSEKCHYLAAIWGQLSDDDRGRFLRRAL